MFPSIIRHGLLSVIIALVFSNMAAAQQKSVKAQARKEFGIDKRVLWTTSKVVGTPDPLPPYQTEIAFAKLKFFEPLEMAVVPDSNRLAIAERPGKILTFVNDPGTSESQLLIDLQKTVYGLAFHPQFAENGYLYVTYILDPKVEQPNGTRLSRFKATNQDPPVADLASETILLEWPSGGHNGGCLRFGPDGYLYLATGDGSGIADGLLTGQDLSDLLGAILRIDVDHPAEGMNYGIPADNPFIDTPNARPEIYSYGHRQVWKYSFDSQTGTLWACEVGQDLWEMVYIIEKGGNYGWGVMEGKHPFRPERPKGPTLFIAPIVEHPHSDFRSITGGFVYHGKRLPELEGTYIYGDYDTGRIWGLKYDLQQKTVIDHRELTDTNYRIVGFGQDPAGEIYLLDFPGGLIHQLKKRPPQVDLTQDFPRKLSETGLFASAKKHQPAAGVIPYSVTAQLWSDGAYKERFLGLPGESQIEFDVVTYPQPAPGSVPGWRFPHGTVLVKTFSLEMEAGNPQSRKRLETRILHHERLPGNDDEYGNQVWNGYTYIWNDDQTDAELLDAKGADKTLTIRDKDAPGGKREQVWHFPSRAECTLCHTMAAKYVLGVSTLQMNRDHNYNGYLANQLATFDHLQLFTEKLPKPPHELPQLVDFNDKKQDINDRARSYLHSNCSHCHRKWGGGNAEFQLLSTLPLAETGTLNIRPGQGAFELNDPRLLVPGDASRSMILHRMTRLGQGRMPHIASNTIDQPAVELIREWIDQLTPTSE
ncbi:MAG: PQQ-dependent sugar dehydrogenase [Planctomycetaceae bacterium]